MRGAGLRVQDYLEHAQQTIERIQRYTAEMDQAAFMQDEMAQDAVIRNIEIIGEAANNIIKCDPGFAREHDEIPWAVIYAMRNRVSHAYHKVDVEIVWKTIQDDLPSMHRQLAALLHSLPISRGRPKP